MFFPAVTVVLRGGCLACFFFGLCFLIITDFYVVFVENLVVPLIFWKMFIEEVQKLSADVFLNVHAVGRVEPNYVSLPVLAAVLCGVICRFLVFSVH